MTDSLAPASPAPPPPVILRATEQEAVGAAMNVAGLSVVDRALRQFGRTPTLRVLVASDGMIPLPPSLPPNVELAPVGAVVEPGVGATVIGADVVRPRNADLDTRIRVIDQPTRRQAEDAVFAELLRGDLGFVARHLNKKISFRITRYLLCHLPVTPNEVTLGAAAFGLLGCFFIAMGTYPAMVVGLSLAQLQSILDGCDGELARVRFQQSAMGEWLDTLVDDFMNLAIVASLGVGLFRAGHGWPAVAAAAAACLMNLTYNIVSYRELIRQGQGGELIKIRWKLTRGRDLKSMWRETLGPTPSGVSPKRLFLALGRRDTFVFGWLLLAVFDVLPFALVWALIVSVFCFVVALGQLIVADEVPAS